MFSFLSTGLAKVLAIVSLILLLTNVVSGWAYLSKRDDYATLKAQYSQTQQALKECEDSKQRNLISAQQDDLINTNLKAKARKIEDDLDAKIKALNSIPKKNCSVGIENEKTNTVDIDVPFDDEFLRVFGHKKRSSNTSTR